MQTACLKPLKYNNMPYLFFLNINCVLWLLCIIGWWPPFWNKLFYIVFCIIIYITIKFLTENGNYLYSLPTWILPYSLCLWSLRTISGFLHVQHSCCGLLWSCLSTIYDFVSIQFFETVCQMDISTFSGQNNVTKLCLEYLLSRYINDRRSTKNW